MDVKQVGNLIDKGGWDNPQVGRIYSADGISPTLNTCGGGQREPKVIVSMRGRNPENPSDRTAGISLEQRLEPNSQGISNALTSVQKDNMVLEKTVTTAGKNIASTIRSSIHKQGERNILQNIENGLGYEGVIEPTYRIRKLTPKECWRLMSFSDWDFEKAAKVNSSSQLYKEAGNSIVENCLIAIFSQLGIKGVQKWNDGLKHKYESNERIGGKDADK